MRRSLHDRRILITGASSGIGRCLSEQLAAGGARLVLAARSAEKLEVLAGGLRERFGADVHPVPADITVPEDRRRLVGTAERKLGGLDVLLNNAGVASWSHFADSTEV